MNNRQIAAIGAMTLALTTCSSAALGVTNNWANPITTPEYQNIVAFKEQRSSTTNLIDLVIGREAAKGLIERQAELAKIRQEAQKRHEIRLKNNAIQLKHAVGLAKKQVNKTWYVFSGSTPSGWDCSGLVLWTYKKLDINLEHSATKQMRFGNIVTEPKFGDIVGFSWNGSKRYYHVGIYLADGMMLHSGGKKGDRTEIVSISDFAGSHSKIAYSRIVETSE